MQYIRQSPFKVNLVEDDPRAFGLRPQDTLACAEALYNARSVLITGPRGIGKSSLGSQMQLALTGDNTLLRRSQITTKFPTHLTAFYACDKANTLSQLASDLLFTLEQEARAVPPPAEKTTRPSIEINLGVIKASLESETKATLRTPATVAAQLVAGINEIIRQTQGILGARPINIMLDEVDELSQDINFGHFMKVLHETIHRTAKTPVTFILAGQQGVYSRFFSEDSSFERIVRHVPLARLDPDSSEYIMAYAATHASPQFTVTPTALDLILAIASGFPYVIHLLGDAAFHVMSDYTEMRRDNVLLGLQGILNSDKREKYTAMLRELDDEERLVVMKLSERGSKTVPVEIPLPWLHSRLDAFPDSQANIDTILRSLEQKGYIRLRSNRTIVVFCEELFRIFVSLGMLEQLEIRLRRVGRDASMDAMRRQAQDIAALALTSQWDKLPDLPSTTRDAIVSKVRTSLARAIPDNDSDQDDELYDIYDEYITLPEDVDIADLDDVESLDDADDFEANEHT